MRGNVANETDDVMWGVPGTSADVLHARRGEDGLWRQDDDYRGLGSVHGAAGNTLALRRFKPDDPVAAETAAVLARHAFREDGLANWPGSPRPQLADPRRGGSIRLQWCTGAPGIVAGAWDYLDEDLLLAGAELVWRAGAHGRRERPRPLPRHLGQRLRAPQDVRAHRRRAVARARPSLRRPRTRPGGADRRGERPPSLLPLHRRRRYGVLCGQLLDLDARYPVVDIL